MRTTNTTIFAMAVALGLAGTATADTLERVRQSGEIRLGYRTDAVPFAYAGADGAPAGYSVALCEAVADDLGAALRWVEVGAENRFAMVRDGEIDLLCGATSATLGRRETVDFSIATFVDGGSVLLAEGAPASFAGLGGHTIGVREATTTEEALRDKLRADGVDAEVVPVASHDAGLAGLVDGTLDAYFADQAILMFLQAQSDAALTLSPEVFTIEPYALALPYGDNPFRLAVDRALSGLYRSGAVAEIFADAFGPEAEPGPIVQALWTVSALPE
jgi:ABC-type amino acid transport substrate-binding protein